MKTMSKPKATWVKYNVKFGHSYAENCNNYLSFKHGLHHHEDNIIMSDITTAGEVTCISWNIATAST